MTEDTELPETTRRTIRPLVWQAVLEIDNSGQVITRQKVMALTQLGYEPIDDVLNRAVDKGVLRRIAPGTFELVEQYPPQDISQTVLSNGYTKIEVGDGMITISPTTKRTLARMLHGDAVELANLQHGRELVDALETMRSRLHDANKRTATVHATVMRLAQVHGQGELFRQELAKVARREKQGKGR